MEKKEKKRKKEEKREKRAKKGVGNKIKQSEYKKDEK